MYSIAYGADSVWFGSSRQDLEVKEPEKVKYHESYAVYSDWKKENTYSYQLILPQSNRQWLFSTLSEDLQKLFPQYECKIEPRERLCWVLSINPKIEIPVAEQVSGFARIEPKGYTMRNASIKAFLTDMNVLVHQNSPFPIINETNLNYNIDLDLESRLSDMETLARELESKGFSLKKENRKISVLVLKDKPVSRI